MTDRTPNRPSDGAEDRHVFVVFTNSKDGQDDDFNAWYDQHHLREIVGLDGFVWGQRFELHPEQRPGQVGPPWRYLALYEVRGDVPGLHELLKQRSGTFVKTSALKNDHVAWVYSYRGDRVDHDDAPEAEA